MTNTHRQRVRRKIGRALEWLGDALWGLCQADYSFAAAAYCFLRARGIGERESDAILRGQP